MMIEPVPDKDMDLVKKMNDLMNPSERMDASGENNTMNVDG
jgi:hypothetical protein